MEGCGEHQRSAVARDLRGMDRQTVTRRRLLKPDDRVAGSQRLERIAGAHVLAVIDRDFFRKVLEVIRIERAVEGDANFTRTGGPGGHGLRRLLACEADLVK